MPGTEQALLTTTTTTTTTTTVAAVMTLATRMVMVTAKATTVVGVMATMMAVAGAIPPPFYLTHMYYFSVPGHDWRRVIQTGSSWSLPLQWRKALNKETKLDHFRE